MSGVEDVFRRILEELQKVQDAVRDGHIRTDGRYLDGIDNMKRALNRLREQASEKLGDRPAEKD